MYDYPPNLAQMKQSYASRKRMLLYRVIFQERIIGFAELDFCILQMVRVSLVVYQNNTRAIRCYEACGFRMEEALIRKGRPDAWIMRALPAEKK